MADTRARRLFSSLGLFLLLVVALAPIGARGHLRAAAPADAGEIRALWVLAASLTSAESIDRMVQAARINGFNTLLVQVRPRGDAYYESSIEPRGSLLTGESSDFDPLQVLIAAARAAGLNVHAWISVNLVSSARDLPADRTHLVHRQPDWLMVPRDLAASLAPSDPRDPEYVAALARWTRAQRGVEGLYVSPIPHGAAAHAAAVVGALVRRYELAGVHLDYVRYPGEQFDYSRAALAEFRASLLDDLTTEEQAGLDARAAAEPLIYADMFPRRWSDFRRSRLTALVMRIRTAAHAARPGLQLSAAVVPDSAEAAARRFQDWRTWLEAGLLDAVCPMAYTPDAAEFAEQIRAARSLAGGAEVWAGIGAYRLSPTRTVDNIQTARQLGVAGVALFSYDSLIDRSLHPPDALGRIGRAAFGEMPLTNSR